VEHEFTPIKRAYLPVNLPLGGVEQDILILKRKEVRALPHFVGIGGIAPLRKGMEVGPIASVRRAIEQHRAANLVEA
jgi:hypothetical protein